MAKLTDAQTSTLARGAQQANGFISPAPKTPVAMAIQAAKKLEVLGLVQEAPCFHDEPFYFRDEDRGDCVGYRLTAAGFDALGIDESERPAYCAAAPDVDADPQDEAATDEPATVPETAVELQDALEESLAAGVPAKGYGEVMADPPQPIGKASLGTAADAVLAAWGLVLSGEVTGAQGIVQHLRPSITTLAAVRAPKPAKTPKTPRAPRAEGEVAAPREGSKMATVITLVSRAQGCTIAQVQAATGWTATSARGFLSSLHTKRGLPITSAKGPDGVRVYMLETGAAAEEADAAA